ncbi:hypothetical protein Ahy_A09g043212 [Arachis hypogaea]|uniref:MULE transposase domain-containing protein n=1 Tax=Arachis hypogaea TaxID=3818 RepID=A0A445BHU5_ARAHY|nr:hypothetical protein Ahy_A09g043212 [Arachis hypogaea]
MLKQSVPTEREQEEHSGSVNKGKEQVVAAGLRDEDDGYESEGLWDVLKSDDEGDPLLRRPMIGLDGCFIKTPYGGQLLIAIGWDPNDQILPIAYAVVEAKTKDLWRWFLLNLKETYVDCYQHVIYPLNGPNLWSWTENDDVLLPVFRKPIGRPKLSRNKTGDEPRNNGPLSKLSRTGQQQKCSYCFALGHNKRTCPRKCKMEASVKKNATPQAKKGTGRTRTPKPSKIPAKTTTQPATKLQPKRKSNTQVGGSQESQASSKRARCNSSTC